MKPGQSFCTFEFCAVFRGKARRVLNTKLLLGDYAMPRESQKSRTTVINSVLQQTERFVLHGGGRLEGNRS